MAGFKLSPPSRRVLTRLKRPHWVASADSWQSLGAWHLSAVRSNVERSLPIAESRQRFDAIAVSPRFAALSCVPICNFSKKS